MRRGEPGCARLERQRGDLYTGRPWVADLKRRISDYDNLWLRAVADFEAAAECEACGGWDRRFAVDDNCAIRREYSGVAGGVGVWSWLRVPGFEGPAKARPLLHELPCSAVFAQRFLRSSNCIVLVGI